MRPFSGAERRVSIADQKGTISRLKNGPLGLMFWCALAGVLVILSRAEQYWAIEAA